MIIAHQKQEQNAESCHIGEPGKRMTLKVKVTKILPKEGNYGVIYITNMLAFCNKSGFADQITWFASKNDMEPGKTYTIKCTVKSHGKYKGQKQTIVTRCKCLD